MIEVTQKPWAEWDTPMQQKLQNLSYGRCQGLLYYFPLIRKVMTFVAFQESDPVGWAVVDLDEYILQIYVKESCRKMGVGSHLMTSVNQFAQVAERTLTLFPSWDNPHGWSLAKKFPSVVASGDEWRLRPLWYECDEWERNQRLKFEVVNVSADNSR